MITSTAQCCTDDATGVSRAYTAAAGMSCCGTQQVFANVTKCCNGRAHAFISTFARDNDDRVCCGENLIAANMSCCHGNAYDPATSTCSDRDTSGAMSSCGVGTVCPAGQTAFCDMCGFDTSEASCFTVDETVIATEVATMPLHTDDGGTVHTLAGEYEACTLVVCDASQSSCNGTCHDDNQVCCDGVLHDFNASKRCCGTSYVKSLTSFLLYCSLYVSHAFILLECPFILFIA